MTEYAYCNCPKNEIIDDYGYCFNCKKTLAPITIEKVMADEELINNDLVDGMLNDTHKVSSQEREGLLPNDKIKDLSGKEIMHWINK